MDGQEEMRVVMAKADDNDFDRVRSLLECLDEAAVAGIDDDGYWQLQERYRAAESSLERIIFGYQILRDSFCDPDVNHLQLNPKIVAAAQNQRPTVVCLCGSTRFKQQFIETNFKETMAGRIVLTVGWFGHADANVYTPTVDEKMALDELHKRKIDMADEILVINVGGYIGESTRSEIDHALKTGKPVRWLEPVAAPAP